MEDYPNSFAGAHNMSCGSLKVADSNPVLPKTGFKPATFKLQHDILWALGKLFVLQNEKNSQSKVALMVKILYTGLNSKT